MRKLLLLLTVASCALTAQGQTRAWRVYSSTDDDRFTVEIPRSSNIVKTIESKNEANLSADEKRNFLSYVSAYEDASASDQRSQFLIGVINGQAALFKSVSREKLLWYLSVLIIGDDDDPHPTRVRTIKVNRLVGKEYVWDKQNRLFSRGRIFDRGDKIYVIVFKGENSKELKSPTVERFLSSFRLQKRNR